MLQWLAWSAPMAIVLATAFVWAEDTKHSKRSKASSSPRKVRLARSVGYAAIVGEILLLGGLSVLAWFPQGVPEGFVPGTVMISLSAVVFLGLISWMRDRTPPIGAAATSEIRAEDDRQQRAEIEFFTVGLFVVAFMVGLAVWISATNVSRFLGSMVVAYFWSCLFLV